MSKRAYVLLLLLSCLQLAGTLLGLPILQGIGMASAASPLPRVFTANRGLEAFSSRYRLVLRDTAGDTRVLEMSSTLQARMRGPYNRRNAYGAIMAFGPILQVQPSTRSMFLSVARHALCADAPLLRELGIDPTTIRGVRILEQLPREGTRTQLALSLEVPCS